MKLQKLDLHTRTFRSFFAAVAGTLMLMAAFAPSANATVLVYFNFEDGTLGGAVDFTSDVVGPPDFNPGGGIVLTTITTTATVFASVDGLLLNRTPGDIDTADPGLAVGFRTTPVDNGSYIQFATAGNGFDTVQLSYFVNGVETIVGSQPIVTGGAQIITFAVPPGANNQPTLVLRLTFNGGMSQGNNLQTIIDNIQLNGTAVPEPATVVSGLLGVLGLGWHQWRRLIRSVRLRRT